MKKLIPAFQKNETLINDIKKRSNTEGVHIWWLGQSGFLISWEGKHLLFDPYLSDSLTIKYAETKKPHVRMSELVVNPADLDMVDIVTSSHNHTDHLDGDTLIPLLKANPKMAFVIPEANRAFIANRVQCPFDMPYGLSDGDTLKIKGFTITGVPAAHNHLERDEKGKLKYMGFVVQFGKYSVYHSGDTLWYDGMVDILKPFQVDIAFLPINGNKPERGVAGNLDCIEAAELGKQIGAKCVIPHHYDMFAFNTADVLDFVKEAEKRGVGYKVLRIGERYSI
jgi:L-ascorbate metabolism protein UlaG (beta-lactamase superfamily)